MIEDLSTILVVGSVLFLLMGFTLLLLGILAFKSFSKKSNYVPIVAKCVNHKMMHGYDSLNKMPVYEANYKNKRYEFSDILLMESMPKKGDERRFYIDPANPENYYIEGKPEEYKECAIVGLICAIVGAALFCANLAL